MTDGQDLDLPRADEAVEDPERPDAVRTDLGAGPRTLQRLPGERLAGDPPDRLPHALERAGIERPDVPLRLAREEDPSRRGRRAL